MKRLIRSHWLALRFRWQTRGMDLNDPSQWVEVDRP